VGSSLGIGALRRTTITFCVNDLRCFLHQRSLSRLQPWQQGPLPGGNAIPGHGMTSICTRFSSIRPQGASDILA
jgi:hypothetical protein